MELDIDAISQYGYQAGQGDKAAMAALKDMGIDGVLTIDELWEMNEHGSVWVYKISTKSAIREKPYVAYVPTIHIMEDRNSLTQGEFHLLADENARNYLEMRFYGISWLAFLDCPIEKPVLNTLRVDPLFAVPVMRKERKNVDTVAYFDGVGVSYPGKDFPIRIGATYWLVPQREDFNLYEADFYLSAKDTDQLTMFNGFPLQPVAIPFVVNTINISGHGLIFEMHGDEAWMAEHREWYKLEAKIPLQYPNIYQLEDDAVAYAASIKGWD